MASTAICCLLPPHVKSSPSWLTAARCCTPTAVLTNKGLSRTRICTGAVVDSTPRLKACPHDHNMPPRVTTSDCPPPQAAMTTGAAQKAEDASTCAGARDGTVCPRPSSPCALLPSHSAPLPVTARA